MDRYRHITRAFRYREIYLFESDTTCKATDPSTVTKVLRIPIGNFISKAGVTQYYSATKPHAVTSLSNGASFTYDANGNMTQRVELSGTQWVTYTQQWNVDNKLIAITSSLGYTATYAYNADGERVLQRNSAAETFYVGNYHEKDMTHGVRTTYYYFGGQRVAMRQNNAVYWLHGDHLGSASLTTNITGAVISEVRYYPFGETRWVSGTLPTDRLFTGQRVEAGTGLYDYNARMYSPMLGRFISADTIVPTFGNLQNLNRYSYVLNNPLIHSDPSGHCYDDVCGWPYVPPSQPSNPPSSVPPSPISPIVSPIPTPGGGGQQPTSSTPMDGVEVLGGILNWIGFKITRPISEKGTWYWYADGDYDLWVIRFRARFEFGSSLNGKDKLVTLQQNAATSGPIKISGSSIEVKSIAYKTELDANSTVQGTIGYGMQVASVDQITSIFTAESTASRYSESLSVDSSAKVTYMYDSHPVRMVAIPVTIIKLWALLHTGNPQYLPVPQR